MKKPVKSWLLASTVATLLAAPVALPASIITGAGYLVAVGGVTATLSQLTKE